MKKSIFSLMIGAIVALTSCSKSDELPTSPQEGDCLATFTVEAPALTRATPTLSRYIVEAYEGKDLTATPLRVESANGTLELTLKKNTDYTFLFWADKGTAKTATVASTGYWDATTLKGVKVTAGKENTVGEAAYCLVKEFNSKDFETNKAITLRNATAQVNFIETAGLLSKNNTLIVTYATGATLNVATGKVTDVASKMIHTFTGIAKAAADATLAIDYVLSPLGEQNVVNLKMQFNAEPEKAIDNVPFQQNYKTNIKGEFSNFYASTFDISNEVEDYTNNPDVEFPVKAKVGDFYMKNGTWLPGATTLTADQKANCLGIVFVVNADGKSGKIVGLTEGTSLAWSTKRVETRATDLNNGRTNMATLADFIADPTNNTSWNEYPAFKWVAQQNGKANGGWDAANDKWYLPAKEELKALYGKYSGDTKVDDNVKVAVNASLNAIGAIGAKPLAEAYSWTSTEYTSTASWCVTFSTGVTDNNNLKTATNYRARCVREF